MATKKNPDIEKEAIEKEAEEPKKAEEEPKKEAEEEERVLVFIPYTPGEDPEVTVGINGVYTKIQKGKQVRVSQAVAEVLQNSSEQIMVARANSKKLEKQVTDL